MAISAKLKHDGMVETLDVFQDSLDVLMNIEHGVAMGYELKAEEIKLWAAAERFVKIFRGVQKVVKS